MIDHALMPYLCEHVHTVQVYAVKFHRESKARSGKRDRWFPIYGDLAYGDGKKLFFTNTFNQESLFRKTLHFLKKITVVIACANLATMMSVLVAPFMSL